MEQEEKATTLLGSRLPAQPQTRATKLSSNIQKLRFMKIAEHDREQTQLRVEGLEQDANIRWCILGYENDTRAAKSNNSANSSAICVQARRSYKGMNKTVEVAMLEIARRMERKHREYEELDQARRLQANNRI